MSDVLKTAMDNAATECSLAAPSLFATNSTSSYVQLKRYMNQAAAELLNRHDWARLTIDGTVTGTGATTYALASDFHRLVRRDEEHDPAVWSDDMRRAFRPVQSNGEWTVLQSMGPTPSYGYRIVGDNIEFTQAIASGDTVTYAYVSKKWIEHSSSGSESWADDADFTYLPPRLIELGVTWRWKRFRGLEFQSYLGEFEIEYARATQDDRGLRKISMGSRPRPASPYDGLPVPVLGPDPNA